MEDDTFYVIKIYLLVVDLFLKRYINIFKKIIQ